MAGTLIVVSTFSACGGGSDDPDAPVLNGTGALKDAKAATPVTDAARQRLDDLAQRERDAAAAQAARERATEQARLAADAAEKERLAAEEARLAAEAAERANAARRARLAAEAAERERLAAEAAERERLADEAARQQRFESAVDALNKRGARLVSAISEDLLARRETGDLGSRMQAASDDVQKILSAATAADAAKDDALLRRMIEVQRHVDRVLAERDQWLAKEPERQAARERAARLRREQAEAAAREAAERLRREQQEAEAREAQKEIDAAKEAERDAATRRARQMADQEADICNPADVTIAHSHGRHTEPAHRLTHITITLKTAGVGPIGEADEARVDAALQRALRMHAKRAGAGGIDGPLLLLRPIDQQAVKIDRFLPDGSALVNLGQAVTREEVQRLRDYLLSDATVRAADPDSGIVLHHLTTHTSGGADVRDRLWHLKRINADQALALLPNAVARKAVATAVLDSGWVGHLSLAESQYRGGVNFSKFRDGSPTAQQYYTFNFPYPPGEIITDELYHGTSVAGFIGASDGKRKSALTVHGVNPGSRLLPVRMGLLRDSMRHSMTSDMAEAIYWLAGKAVSPYGPPDVAVRVINISLGRPTDSSYSRYLEACPAPLQQAIHYANDQGITVVSSAGNNDSPASWSVPGNCEGVITVGGTNQDDRRLHWPHRKYAGSGYGKAVTISAPAENVWAINVKSNRGPLDNPATRRPVTDGEYETKVTGTSFAAPQVAGVVSLMLAANPSLRPAQIKTILMETADTKMQGLPVCQRPAGAGIVDAKAAVKRAQQMAAS
jgi:serine protease